MLFFFKNRNKWEEVPQKQRNVSYGDLFLSWPISRLSSTVTHLSIIFNTVRQAQILPDISSSRGVLIDSGSHYQMALVELKYAKLDSIFTIKTDLNKGFCFKERASG